MLLAVGSTTADSHRSGKAEREDGAGGEGGHTAPTAFVISGATHSSASRGLVSTVGGKKKQNP